MIKCDLHRSHMHNNITCPPVREVVGEFGISRTRARAATCAASLYLGRSFARAYTACTRVHTRRGPRVSFCANDPRNHEPSSDGKQRGAGERRKELTRMKSERSFAVWENKSEKKEKICVNNSVHLPQ